MTNQLPDEDAIRKILEEKVKTKEEIRVCLASVIEKELQKAIKSGQICEENAGMYWSVLKSVLKKMKLVKYLQQSFPIC